jgi:hypothetical protein
MQLEASNSDASNCNFLPKFFLAEFDGGLVIRAWWLARECAT